MNGTTTPTATTLDVRAARERGRAEGTQSGRARPRSLSTAGLTSFSSHRRGTVVGISNARRTTTLAYRPVFIAFLAGVRSRNRPREGGPRSTGPSSGVNEDSSYFCFDARATRPAGNARELDARRWPAAAFSLLRLAAPHSRTETPLANFNRCTLGSLARSLAGGML